jgi:HTH-type transcriptional regulator/antitoxin HigA
MPTRHPRISDHYFDLVRAFPLIPIRNGRHLDEAQRVLDALLQRDLDPGEQAYLDVLTDLVEAYESAHVPIPDASESDTLRALMAMHGLTQPALSQAVGIAQSTLSAVLTGARSLTRAQVVTLARFFHVSPAAFLPTVSEK